MKKQVIVLILSVFVFVQIADAQNSNDKSMDNYINSLLKKMTLEEKLGQLNLITPLSKTGPFATKNANDKLKDGSAGNIFTLIGSVRKIDERLSYADSTRLKIPLFSGLDIIHGYKTVFPIPIGVACSWDTTLIEKTAHIAAVEASAMGYNWTFSPMVDIARDPRWGRVMEGSGEDPYLGSCIARAMVHGYQGEILSDSSLLMACVKHFALYGAAEAGREYNTVDMSKIRMYQDYLPPYKAAIDAGAISVMASFNTINEVPATANKWLLTDLLRNQWNFKGFVVTDYNAIQELENHGVAANLQQTSELAMNAGVDMDMVSEGYVSSMKELLKEKKITMQQIDNACRRVLVAKYKMGLFTHKRKNLNEDEIEKVTTTPASLEIARKIADESIVLLKNTNDILPLKKDTKIALIGSFANDRSEMTSSWAFLGRSSAIVSMFDGLKKANASVNYAQGSQISSDSILNSRLGMTFDSLLQKKLVNEALALANSSNVVVAVLGESKNMSGESVSRSEISIPECQRELLKALKATGKPVILVLVNGRPLTIGNDLPNADAVLETWRLGTEAGDALADVLFGDYNPSGKLTMTFPRNVGQIPIYYNELPTGRPYDGGKVTSFLSNYKDEYNTPQFPFGYGLSYTTFKYSPIQLSDTLLKDDSKTLTVKVKLSNTGKYAGTETVQLYLHDLVASVSRPVKELKQFRKVYLQPGEQKVVTFTLTPEDLKFYNADLQWDWESGKFEVFVGTNSQDVESKTFTWNK